jgi:nitrogen-specific signal transduction histidine kinase
MTGTDLDAATARRRLYEVMQSDSDFEDKAERALAIGEAYLGVANGHVTRIDPENDYWRAIASTDSEGGQFPPGLVLDLGMTYCRRTIASDGPVAVDDAAEQGWDDDPAYEQHGLSCYHGTTLSVEGEPYGTVCFVADAARSEPFTDDETLFAELVARMLEHELERQRTRSKLDRLDEFASIVSHDLRNPLNVAQLSIESARATRDCEHLSRAETALDRMDGLIEDVLAVARQGQAVERTESVTLSEVVDACWEMVETDDATVTVEEDVRFAAEPDRVRRLFENLFRNCIEHGSTGTQNATGSDDGVEGPSTGQASQTRQDRTGSVSVRAGRLDCDGFYVADDGPGVPAERRDRIFESGFSTGDDGSGLGLAIVKSIVDAHGWAIDLVESDDGGARFEVTGVVIEPDR